VLLAVDLGLRGAEMLDWRSTRWLAYAGSLSAELVAYGVAFQATRHVWRRSRTAALVVAGLGAALLSAWTVSAFVYYGLFRGYPAWADLVFLSEEGGHFAETWSLIAGFLDARVLTALAAIGVLIFTLWRFALARAAGLQAQRRDSLALGLGLCLLLGSRAAVSDNIAMSPSGSLLISGAQLIGYYSRRTRGALYASEQRAAVPQLKPAVAPPNVLLLLQESLSRDRMSLYGYQRPTTPKLAAWVRAHAANEVLFANATANASNTSIALVSLLTGLPPDASSEQLHEQPFAWQYARAAGYHTFLRSAQSFRYANFDDYFLSTPADDTWTAERDVVPMANGGGMDDELFIPRVHEAFTRARELGKPFFGVVQFNSTHFPYLVKPDRPNPFGSDKHGRYHNAMLLLDGVLVGLLEWLDAQQQLDNTLVILTSDHGESLDEHEPHRTQSYHEEVTGIPLLVHVPSSLISARPELIATLRENQGRRVQNLDLLPTVLDAMGVLHSPALASLVQRFGGQSLFTSVPADRPVLIMNNNAVRTWVNEGFAVANGDQKYIFSERYGEALYDLSSDPGERTNRWDPQRRPAWYDDVLQAHPDLCALRTRHCKPSAGCQPIACTSALASAHEN
jgi:phosphoglycerol transferase MdoB-like AlkP superfamily enzyme